MNHYTQDRALFAANTLVYLAIAFGTLSFWSEAFEAGEIIDYVIAALLTAGMLGLSFLLSGVVVRFAESMEKGHRVTAGLVVFFGIGLGLMEAGMTHMGLAWLDARREIGPDWALFVASGILSTMNVFALYVFAREIKDRRMQPKPAALLANERWNKERAKKAA